MPSNVIKSSNAYIVDNGACTMKAGFSNSKRPRLVPNCIMKAKSERRRPFIGEQIDECRDASGLFYILPFQKGYVVNWDIQKTLWDHVFSEQGAAVNFRETALLITDPYFNFPSIQDTMTEIFFEEYDCQSLLRVNPSDLSAYHYFQFVPEAESCLVVDSGYSFTHIIPYFNNSKFKEGIIRIDVGGKLLTNHLKEIISYRQLHVMDETYVINQVKEDVCYVSEDFVADMQKCSNKGHDNDIVLDYILPDYTTINRGYAVSLDKSAEISNDYQKLRLANERIAVPETLFHPSDIGINQMGISEAIVASINRCPVEEQPQLFNNIVLTGGNMLFRNIQNRIYDDVRKLVPEEMNVNVHLPDDPVSFAWTGGVHLSHYSEFYSYVVTREEYDEEGLHKCYQRFQI